MAIAAMAIGIIIAAATAAIIYVLAGVAVVFSVGVACSLGGVVEGASFGDSAGGVLGCVGVDDEEEGEEDESLGAVEVSPLLP
jgi:hypothetical protein